MTSAVHDGQQLSMVVSFLARRRRLSAGHQRPTAVRTSTALEGWLLSVTWHAQMSAAEVTCPSRMEGSNDHCTSVTSLTTHASLSRFENDSSLPR